MSIPSPAGWLPPNVARNVYDYAMPSKQDFADNLGRPVDAVAYLLSKAGIKVPSEWKSSQQAAFDPVADLADLYRKIGLMAPSNPGIPQGQTWRPTADMPFGSAWFENALNNGPDISWQDLWRAFQSRSRGLF
jgi:hypothetical protein